MSFDCFIVVGGGGGGGGHVCVHACVCVNVSGVCTYV